ncbi:MAG: amidohydrolase family protein [Thermoproteota archaeon]
MVEYMSKSGFIDVHTHVLRPEVKDAPPMTVEELLRRMDELGIGELLVLPIVSPESGFFYFTTESVLQLYERFPDKLIPFCNIDPRCSNNSPSTDFRWVLSEYREAGCKGLGEVTANIYFNDTRALNLFRQCGEIGLPVLFHMATKIGGVYGLADDIVMPRLEKALSSLPQTIFIGHAMAFWAEISGEVDPSTRGGYPKGKINRPSRLAELLSKYDNLYGDLSASSGYNAITRDLEYGCKFLEEFQDKLLFGTDICDVNQDIPIVGHLRDLVQQGKISSEAFRKISRDNVKKLLNL